MTQPQFYEYAPGYQYSWSDAPQQPFIVENMIPSTGTVLMFGPSGVGKTTVACNLLNAIAQNQQFLGRNTNKVNSALLSCDTPRTEVIRRWLTAVPQFKPEFWFWPRPGFNSLMDGFETTKFYQDLEKRASEEKVGLVIVDSLRDIFHGELKDDSMPARVYSVFQKWFNEATVVFLHHTRKAQYFQGKAVQGDVDDEATGSKYWINKAQVSLSLRELHAGVIQLQMGKSQCFAPWDEPIKMEMDRGHIIEWTDTVEAQRAATWDTAYQHIGATNPQWGSLTEPKRLAEVAKHLGVSHRTARRMRGAAKHIIP